MKKIKQPGDNISLKTKKSEDPAVMDWINAQSNLMDSLRYLIEREIAQHGVRNLQAYIPAERNMLRDFSASQPPEKPPAAVHSQSEPASSEEKDVAEDQQEVSAAGPVLSEPAAQEAAAEEEIDEEDIAAWI